MILSGASSCKPIASRVFVKTRGGCTTVVAGSTLLSHWNATAVRTARPGGSTSRAVQAPGNHNLDDLHRTSHDLDLASPQQFVGWSVLDSTSNEFVGHVKEVVRVSGGVAYSEDDSDYSSSQGVPQVAHLDPATANNQQLQQQPYLVPADPSADHSGTGGAASDQGDGPQVTSTLLRVEKEVALDDGTAQRGKGSSRLTAEVHLVPLTPELVAAVHPATRTLHMALPKGFLDLGRQAVYLEQVRQALGEYLLAVQSAGVSRKRGRHARSNGAGTYTSSRSQGSISTASAKTAVNASGAVGGAVGGVMPRKSQLLAAGRQDLVKLILKAGGFTRVATYLGLKTSRRPPGHWEDPLNLDSALAEFVMGHWVALEGGGPEEEEDEEQGASAGAPAAAGSVETVSVVQGGGKQGSGAQQQRKRPKAAQPLKYWYNQVSQRITLDRPTLVTAPASPAAGMEAQQAAAEALLEAEDPRDRVMPTSTQVMAAGRWDLHHAILRQGGYTEVAAALGRRRQGGNPFTGGNELGDLPSQQQDPHQQQASLKAELEAVCQEVGLPGGTMPTEQHLVAAERLDLVHAVRRRGGFPAVARQLGLRPHRRPRGEMRDLSAAAHAMLMFMVQQQQRALEVHVRILQPHLQVVTREQEELLMHGEEHLLAMSRPEELQELLGRLCRARGDYAGVHQMQLPARKTLREAGRSDLLYALQIHGSEKLAEVCGVQGVHGQQQPSFDLEDIEGKPLFL